MTGIERSTELLSAAISHTVRQLGVPVFHAGRELTCIVRENVYFLTDGMSVSVGDELECQGERRIVTDMNKCGRSVALLTKRVVP